MKPKKPKTSSHRKPPEQVADVVVEKLQQFQPATLLSSLENERTRQVMYELFSSLGDIPRTPDDKRPDWALQAWREFWRSSGIFPAQTSNASDSEQVGFSVGLMSAFETERIAFSPDAVNLMSIFSGVIPDIKDIAAHSPPVEAAEFFCAQKDGQEHASQVLQPTQRAKIFLFIAVAWQAVAEFKSTGELYSWLLAQELIQPPGGKSGKGGTDSREIRKICKIIGLRYADQD